MPGRNCDAWIKVESPVICLDKEPDAGGRAFGIGELYREGRASPTPPPLRASSASAWPGTRPGLSRRPRGRLAGRNERPSHPYGRLAGRNEWASDPYGRLAGRNEPAFDPNERPAGRNGRPVRLAEPLAGWNERLVRLLRAPAGRNEPSVRLVRPLAGRNERSVCLARALAGWNEPSVAFRERPVRGPVPIRRVPCTKCKKELRDAAGLEGLGNWNMIPVSPDGTADTYRGDLG